MGSFGRLSTSVSGSGSVTGEGTAETIDVDVSGSGDVNLLAVRARSGEVDGSGSAEVEPEEVTLADLSDVSLKDTGFVKRPAYDSVEVSTSDRGKITGSFPQSFISFQEKLGTAAFWYNSNGTSDAELKRPLKLAVSFDASDPIEEEAPEATEQSTPSNTAPTVAISRPDRGMPAITSPRFRHSSAMSMKPI